MKKTIFFTLTLLLCFVFVGCDNIKVNNENDNENNNMVVENDIIEDDPLNLDITWIAQAGFILEINGKKLCIDPYLTDSLAAKENLVRMIPVPIEPEDLDVDLVLITHDHGDHFDEDTIARIDKTNKTFAGPNSCNTHFKKMGIEDESIILVNRGDSFVYEDITISGVYAKHTNDSIGYIIEYEDLTLYFVGDSQYDESLVDVKDFNPDVIIGCINGRAGNMGCEEAATLAEELGVQYAISCHYGMFAQNTEDPENFKIALEGKDVEYLEMQVLDTYKIQKEDNIVQCIIQ